MMSCGNKDNKTNTQSAGATVSDTSFTGVAAAWSKEEEGDFLYGCMESVKGQLDEQKAYAYCKCLLSKAQQRFPTLDSAEIVLADTTQAAELSKACK